MWSRLCGAGYVEQVMWSRLCGAGYVEQVMWSRLCGAGYVEQVMWSRLCGAGYVEQVQPCAHVDARKSFELGVSGERYKVVCGVNRA